MHKNASTFYVLKLLSREMPIFEFMESGFSQTEFFEEPDFETYIDIRVYCYEVKV